jgi:lantibiotic modifying enzyme
MSPSAQLRARPPQAPAATQPYVDIAFRIGAQLARSAVWHGALCNWFGPVFEEHAGSHQLACGTLGPGLYDGTAGIALFLGCLHGATGDPVMGRTARGAMEHALSRAEDVPAEIRLGFYTGLVGIGYAATEVGRVLDDGGLVERGLELVRRSLELDPKGGIVIDVMSGNAGVIPALLRLHAQSGDPRLLEAARSRGEALLAHAHRSERGLSWDAIGELAQAIDLSSVSDRLANAKPGDPDRPHLTGFSHGAGGVAWALLELGTAIQDDRFVQAARDGFAYEDSWFDAATDQWLDLRDYRPGTARPAAAAWCHGAVGIGLARMRAFELTGDEADRQNALRALRIATRSVLGGLAGAANYSLCHGLAGDAELFLKWAETTGDGAARQLVDAIAQHGIQAYATRRIPWPSGLENGPEAPSLMLGSAGTGYFYLRAAEPDLAPSILLVCPPGLSKPTSTGRSTNILQ